MNFSKIKNFLKQNKNIFYYIGFFLTIYFIFSDVSFANNTPTANSTQKDVKETAGTLIEGGLKLLSVCLGLITYLAALFLSPEWINGSLFGLNGKFREVWILMSNLVYVSFGFLLIWIAFMNIIGKNENQYQLKQALPKFIIGVLIVPFSWFIVQFVLSLSAILTISAITLPIDTLPEADKQLIKDVKIPRNCIIDLSTQDSTGKNTAFHNCKGEVKLGELLFTGDGASSILGLVSFYTYSLINFDAVGKLTQEELSANSIKEIGDLLVKMGFDVIFILVYSILMITLGFVLMIRGIYIWIFMMVSPLFGLMYFFEKKDGEFFKKFSISSFISLAMVPVYTMLALSFGMLFIYVTGSEIVKGSKDGNVAIKTGSCLHPDQKSTDSCIQIGLLGTPQELIIRGAVSNDNGDISSFLSDAGNNTLGVIGSAILKLLGIVVLWGSVIAAMGSSVITRAITQPMEDFGKNIGKIASSGASNIPIFGGHSMNSLNTAASTVQSSISTNSRNKGSKWARENFLGEDEANAKYDKYANQTGHSTSDAYKNLNEMRSLGTTKQVADNDRAVEGYINQVDVLARDRVIGEDIAKEIKNALNTKTKNGVLDGLHKLDSALQGKSGYNYIGGGSARVDNAYGNPSAPAPGSNVINNTTITKGTEANNKTDYSLTKNNGDTSTVTVSKINGAMTIEESSLERLSKLFGTSMTRALARNALRDKFNITNDADQSKALDDLVGAGHTFSENGNQGSTIGSSGAGG